MSIKIIITKDQSNDNKKNNGISIKVMKPKGKKKCISKTREESKPNLNPKKILNIQKRNINSAFELYSQNRSPKHNEISPMLADFYYSLNKQIYLIDDPTGYWMSEKLDGVRAIWQFPYLRTRNGKLIEAPDEFLEDFPTNITLDGELYVGRKKFGEALSIVRSKQTPKKVWLTKIKYNVFDIPDSAPLNFEHVQKILHTSLQSSFIIPIPQTQCRSKEHLEIYHRCLVMKGGEGTMLRKPKTTYTSGRTKIILKYKSQLDSKTGKIKDVLDENVKVIGYKYDPTRDNRIKSLMVKWCDTDKYPYDPEFSVYHNLTRSELDQAKTLFPIMTIIKVNFNEIFPSSQKPRFPRYAGKII